MTSRERRLEAPVRPGPERSSYSSFREHPVNAERLLEDERARFEDAGIGVQWLGPDGTVLQVNNVVLDTLGYVRDDYVGRSLVEFFTDSTAASEFRARLERGERLSRYTARMRASDGSVRDLRISATPSFEGDRLVRTHCVTIDVSDQIRAEAALGESERRFRLLADAAPVLIWMSGPDKEGIYFNQTWLEFTGVPLEAQLGADWLELVHPEDRGPLSEICLDAFRDRRPFTAEFRLRRSDGEYRWLLDTAVPRFDTKRVFAGFVGSCVDITDHKRSEELRTRLASIVESSDDAIISKSLEGTILSWNVGAERLFGYTAAEAVGRSINDLIVPPELVADEISILERLRRGERIEHYETERITNTGRRIAVSLTISPLRDGLGRIVAASSVARDITFRKQADLALRASEERYRRLVGLLPVAVYTCEAPSGVIAFYNEQAARLWGRAPPLGATDARFCGSFRLWKPDGSLLPHDRTPMAIALREGREFRNESVIIERPDGTRIRVLVNIDPIFDDEGRIVGAINAFHDTTALDRAREELRESEERFRELANNIDQLVWTCDELGSATWYNQRWYEYTGTTPDEVRGWDWQKVHHPDHVERVVARLRESFESGRQWEDTFPLRGQDGGYRWFLSRAFPIRRDDGAVVRWFGTNTDVTELLEAQSALARKEAELQIIAETTPLILNRCTRDLRYRYVNRAAAALFGRTPEEVIGRPIVEVMGETTFAIVRPYIERVLLGERVEYEAELPYTGAGSRWVKASYIPERDAQDEVIGWIASIVDVTAHRHAEAALQASEERYRAIVEGQTEMVCRFRPDGTILFVNGAYARARGATAEALLQANFWDFVAEEDRAGVRAMLESLRPDVSEVSIENRFETTEGTRWTFWANHGLKFDRAGRATEVQSSGIDITARKKLEQSLREADRRKDEFLATLAHELRGPLAPIRNGLDLLAFQGESETETLRLIQEQVRHVVRLVDDLMDVARFMRGRIELQTEITDLGSIVRRAVQMVQARVEERRQDLVLCVPERPVWLKADPVRIVQVIENLLINASKYSDDGGRIELSIESAKSDAILRVRDNGVGIEPELLARVFEPFTQSSRALGRAEGGLGLGLTLVERLVGLHGGTVTAESQGPGRGSTFTVRLPSGAPGPQRKGTSMRAGVLPGRRILVVDDNETAARMLAALLEAIGAHQVDTAHDGPSALAKIDSRPPEILLLDIGLPGMSGFEVVRAVRARDVRDRMLIVALTGYGQEKDRRKSLEAGFDRHLVKPVGREDLEELLATCQER